MKVLFGFKDFARQLFGLGLVGSESLFTTRGKHLLVVHKLFWVAENFEGLVNGGKDGLNIVLHTLYSQRLQPIGVKAPGKLEVRLPNRRIGRRFTKP